MKSSGQQLYSKAKKRIPGGTQLLSKRPEMLLPDQWPVYYSRAKGVEVWDLDGNKYTDMISGGIGACILGYCDPDVDRAVHGAIDAGSMTHLNCPEEVELADLLCDLHPWADMVRYARCGGEAMSVAVRIARAHTRRDKIAFCGYHGWHDWYLAANLGETDVLDGYLLTGLAPNGVPRGLKGTMLPFHYNQLEELEKIIANNGDNLAAIVMEPVHGSKPAPGFLETVREMATKAGAVLVFDEVTSGWRLTTGGAHMVYGVMPDIAVFAKAISNGYPMAAIIGRGDVMQAAQISFISSTYWTEKIGPVAALATIKKHRANHVAKHLIEVGEMMRSGWQSAAESNGIKITVSGISPLAWFSFNYPNAQAIRTLFTQSMLERGYLASNGFYSTYAHKPELIETFSKVLDEFFVELSDAIEEGVVEKLLKGPVAHTGFARLTD
jgi:glutamate-1-semialdehyde aminotransferase